LTDANWYDVSATKDCEVDNYIKYGTDGSFKIIFSDVPCEDDWPDFLGKWKFLSDESEIETNFGGNLDTVTIVTLTEDSFEYKNSDGEGYKFKHK